MSIDPSKEQIFLLGESPSKIGKSRNCVWNYIRHGYPVKREKEVVTTIYLETIQTPTGLATSIQAYNRFLMDIDRASKNGLPGSE